MWFAYVNKLNSSEKSNSGACNNVLIKIKQFLNEMKIPDICLALNNTISNLHKSSPDLINLTLILPTALQL